MTSSSRSSTSTWSVAASRSRSSRPTTPAARSLSSTRRCTAWLPSTTRPATTSTPRASTQRPTNGSAVTRSSARSGRSSTPRLTLAGRRTRSRSRRPSRPTPRPQPTRRSRQATPLTARRPPSRTVPRPRRHPRTQPRLRARLLRMRRSPLCVRSSPATDHDPAGICGCQGRCRGRYLTHVTCRRPGPRWSGPSAGLGGFGRPPLRSVQSYPRVEDGIDEVHGDVGHNDGGRGQQYDPDDHRLVLLVESVDPCLAEARQAEDRLGDHCAAKQCAEVDAELCHHRGQRTAQTVPCDDTTLRYPLGPVSYTHLTLP